jgi:hypothetical protein
MTSEKPKGNKSVHEIFDGPIKAANWNNDSEKGPWYQITPRWRYKDKTADEWKDAYTFNADWEEISRQIRIHRAGNRCEWCGAVNGEPHPVTGSRVVLTVAHVLNEAPMDCHPANLAALCQRCHLRHDAPRRAARRRAARRALAERFVLRPGAATIQTRLTFPEIP